MHSYNTHTHTHIHTHTHTQVSADRLGDVFVRRKGYQRRLAQSSEKTRLLATRTLQATFRRAHLRLSDTRASDSASRVQAGVRRRAACAAWQV